MRLPRFARNDENSELIRGSLSEKVSGGVFTMVENAVKQNAEVEILRFVA